MKAIVNEKLIAAVSLCRGSMIFIGDNMPIGVAARDVRQGEIIEYNSLANTDDILIKMELMKDE